VSLELVGLVDTEDPAAGYEALQMLVVGLR